MLLEALALAWLAGSVAVSQVAVWTLWLAPLVGLALAWRARAGPRPWAILTLAALLAATAVAGGRWYRLHRASASPSDVSHFVADGPTRVRGIVDGDRDVLLNSVEVRLRTQAVEDDSGWHNASGVVLLRLPASTTLQDGDLVEAAGRLRTPAASGSFDWRAYLAQQGIYAEIDYPSTKRLGQDAGPGLQHPLVLLRQRLDGGMHALLPEPEASLGAGLVFGTSRVREPDLAAALRSTNADMIAVATGFNVTLVGLAVLEGLASLIGRRQAALAGLLAMVGYAAVIGFYPSVLRALIMTSAVLCASLAGRPYSAARLLLLACAGMVALDPASLESISFPLSLTATGGVVWLQSWIRGGLRHMLRLTPERADRRAFLAAAADSAATTIAATLASMPVVLAATHSISLGAIPANLILFALLPWLMAASGAAAIAAALGRLPGLLFAPIAYALLWLMMETVRLCAQLPGADLPLAWFGKPAALAAYVPAVAAFRLRGLGPSTRARSWIGAALHRLPPLRLPQPRWDAGVRLRPLLPVSGAFFALTLLSVTAAAGLAAFLTAPGMRVTDLDVSPGAAILIEAGSERILVDGGPAGDATVRALDRTLPPWQRSLSLVVVTQRTADHVGGLPEVAQRYRIGAALDASAATPPGPSAPSDAAWLDWQRAASAAHLARLPGRPQTVIEAGAGTIEIDAASAGRGTRLTPVATVILRSGGRSVLLAGDSIASLPADIRVLPRGDLTPPPSPPAIVLLPPLPAGETPPAGLPIGFGHPLVYSTNANGDVRLTLAAHAVSVHVQRGAPLGLYR